ncbi:MAG: TIGR04255 family protein [Bifidobacteriaceae bacterium]|jgi:uncharacterized protein (TIGR04255 family)|nr:TIGR04255 family protein [Bifidobacteriaceae bacterium]
MSRTIYPNAPVVLAVFEVQHLPTPPLQGRDLGRAQDSLQDVAPLHRVDMARQLQGQFDLKGGVNPQVTAQTQAVSVHRFYTRARELAISYSPASFSLEVSVYRGWNRFADALRRGLEAIARPDGTLRIDGIERIGLRYLDEVRVPGRVPGAGWSDWISPELLPPKPPEGFSLLQQQSLAQYGVNHGADSVTLRYGVVNGPSAFVSTPHLARPAAPVAPYFLLDTDASWMAKPGEPLAEPAVEALATVAHRLHAAAKAMFENSITDKLRNEVLIHD